MGHQKKTAPTTRKMALIPSMGLWVVIIISHKVFIHNNGFHFPK